MGLTSSKQLKFQFCFCFDQTRFLHLFFFLISKMLMILERMERWLKLLHIVRIVWQSECQSTINYYIIIIFRQNSILELAIVGVLLSHSWNRDINARDIRVGKVCIFLFLKKKQIGLLHSLKLVHLLPLMIENDKTNRKSFRYSMEQRNRTEFNSRNPLSF